MTASLAKKFSKVIVDHFKFDSKQHITTFQLLQELSVNPTAMLIGQTISEEFGVSMWEVRTLIQNNR